MLKLNAGLSRKVGEPDYGSRGASVNLELEVEGHLANEPEALMERIRRLFALARTAVDEELNGGRPTNGTAKSSAHTPTKSNGQRPATASQVRAIRSICDRLHIDAEQLATDKFKMDLTSLSLKDASSLIDELKAEAESLGRSR